MILPQRHIRHSISKSNILWIGFLVAIFGCQVGGADKPPVERAATAYDEVLWAHDVEEHIPDEVTREDSIAIANRYIEQWLREQVLLHQAQLQLPIELQTFEREMAAYRNALLLHHYQERFVDQRMESNIPEEEARAYYASHLELFYLTDYVVQTTFVYLPERDDSDHAFIRQALMSNDSLEVFAFERWCVENGAAYSLEAENWWYLNDLIQEVPMQVYRPERQVSDRRLIEFTSENWRYFMRFHRHQLIDQIAPFEVVQERVVELILHSRRQDLLENLEESLLLDAWKSGHLSRTSHQD